MKMHLLIGQLIVSLIVVCGAGLRASGQESSPPGLTLFPPQIQLSVDAPRQQLIATDTAGGAGRDLTREGTFHSADPQVAVVDVQGVVRGVAAGTTQVSFEAGGRSTQVTVSVGDLSQVPVPDFERDIQPILTRHGCNSGPCHGKQRGQNGFQLSLLGFDPIFDHTAIVKEARGRRIFFASPVESLLLSKPTGAVAHGGGVRLEPGSDPYEALVRWIAGGAPFAQPDTPALDHISVLPQQRRMAADEQQQLVVTAHYSDGSTRDVTHLAAYQSNEAPIAAVNEQGVITAGHVTGEVAVMTRYQEQFAIVRVTVPVPGEAPAPSESLADGNFIDKEIAATLERLSLSASSPAPDHKFLRRAYIDIIGRTPTAEEARTFLEDPSPDKRSILIDRLLEQPEYAEHWANKWADLLRPNPYRVGIKATLNYDYWIRDAFRKNKPYDEFVRELITARGTTFHNGNVTLFRDRRSPDELTTLVSQLFLGIRLECAKCHQHPFEVWGQDDFYSFAAYFAQFRHKGTGLSPPISGSEEMVYAGDSGSVKHPLTDEVMQPRPLFGEAPPVESATDLREPLAEWITSPENHFFAQTMANRVWADLMGRGLVEPVDDLRATNPPSNPELLQALGDHFRDNGFDIKALVRAIATSKAYGLSSLPTERNLVDTRNFSRHYRQRLRAEVLLDSVCLITGSPEDFEAMPPGSSAKEIWTHRVDSLFLDAFGRPDPNQDPPCERMEEPTVVQTLHLMNAPQLYAKIAGDEGRAAELAGSDRSPAEIVSELYLWVYSRLPDEEELKIGTDLYDNSDNRRQVTEDLLWALLNTPEFVFKD
jgi:hypothetical protein